MMLVLIPKHSTIAADGLDACVTIIAKLSFMFLAYFFPSVKLVIRAILLQGLDCARNVIEETEIYKL